MVAGIAATYHGVTYIRRVREALAAQLKESSGDAAAARIATAARALDTAIAPLETGPNGLGIAHRDLGRRLNDMLVADFEPTPSVIAGVDGPCQAIDAALDELRTLQKTSVADVNAGLTASGRAVLPAWAPTASPACGPK
jgi:hypothetical protein